MTRVMIIGLDSATPNLIQLGIEAGRLPTFAKFQTEGVFGSLQSTYPPASCPAWNAFSTGQNPGRIGVPWFFVRKRGTYKFQPYIFDDERCEVPFWNYASQAGRHVVVVNVPTMYRASSLNGLAVCGFFRSADSPLTYPPELEQEIEEHIGHYQVDIWDARRTMAQTPDDLGGGSAPIRGDIVFEMARQVSESRQKALRYLLKRYPDWDLFIGVFTALDRLQHRLLTPAMMQADSRIMDYYALLDAYVGDLMELAGADTDIIIMSDHGMGPAHWIFNINDWLQEIGLLHLKAGAQVGARRHGWREILRQMVLPISEQHPAFDHWIQIVKSAIGITKFASSGQTFNPDLIDWERTKAYSYGNYGEIFLNLKGREPSGRVSPDEADELCDYISQQIQSLKFPWRPNSIEVIRGNDVFYGPYSYKMPDLLIKIDDYQCISSSSLRNQSLFIRKKGGVHRLKGVLMARGPSFVRNVQYDEAHIVDIAPTVLHLLGVAVPEDMDGRVLCDLLADPTQVVYQAASDIGLKHDGYSEGDEAILTDRLRALGYLD